MAVEYVLSSTCLQVHLNNVQQEYSLWPVLSIHNELLMSRIILAFSYSFVFFPCFASQHWITLFIIYLLLCTEISLLLLFLLHARQFIYKATSIWSVFMLRHLIQHALATNLQTCSSTVHELFSLNWTDFWRIPSKKTSLMCFKLNINKKLKRKFSIRKIKTTAQRSKRL